MSTIQTFTGRLLDVKNPNSDEIVIEDIAHALSMQCRFNGHLRTFYSVAEHCCRGVALASGMGREVQRAFLLHDAAEAYVGDMAAPIKNNTEAGEKFAAMETVIAGVIAEKWGLSVERGVWARVHDVDIMMLAIEKTAFGLGNGGKWPKLPELPVCPWNGDDPLGQSPEVARGNFLALAGALL